MRNKQRQSIEQQIAYANEIAGDIALYNKLESACRAAGICPVCKSPTRKRRESFFQKHFGNTVTVECSLTPSHYSYKINTGTL